MNTTDETKRVSLETQETLAATIEAEIARGAFRAGDRLDERTLAQRFGISRTPVREVLKRLASQGVLEARPHQGTFVPVPTVSDILLTYEILGALESLAARLAARRATIAERERLRATAAECLAVAGTGDLANYARLNLMFHEQIYEMAKNHLLEENSRRIRQKLAPFRRMTFDLPGHMLVSANEHVAITEAIAAGKSDEAASLIENHLNINRADFRDLFIVISNELSSNAGGASPRILDGAPSRSSG